MLVLFFCGFLAAGLPTLASSVMASVPAQDPSLLEAAAAPGPLRRLADPVLVTGEMLPEDFLGVESHRLRLYSHRDGALVPIRFQVDERTEEGDWVFAHGKRNNRYRSTGRLDGQDVILFMARDAGPEAAGTLDLPGEPERILPIEIADPVDRGRGWVYLALRRGFNGWCLRPGSATARTTPPA